MNYSFECLQKTVKKSKSIANKPGYAKGPQLSTKKTNKQKNQQQKATNPQRSANKQGLKLMV